MIKVGIDEAGHIGSMAAGQTRNNDLVMGEVQSTVGQRDHGYTRARGTNTQGVHGPELSNPSASAAGGQGDASRSRGNRKSDSLGAGFPGHDKHAQKKNDESCS